VIHVGSFSKNLAPALRLGFLVGPWPVLNQMIAYKSGGTGALEQMVVVDFLRHEYKTHADGLKQRLKAKRVVLIEALEVNFGTAVEFRVPSGGIYLWIKLPPQVDTLKLADASAKQGVVFNPGS